MDCNKLTLVTLLALFTLGATAQQRSAEQPIFSSSLDNANVIELYPNPAVDYLMVELKNSNLKEATFELHSMIGNKVMIEPELVSEDRYRISLDGYAAGYYFLVIRDDYSRFKKAYRFLKN